MAGRPAPRPDGDRPPHARPERRLARGQRSRPWSGAGRGDNRGRPADGGRPVPRARGQVDPLDPAPGGAVAPRRRRGRRAGRRRRHLDGVAARGIRQPHPGPDRRPGAGLRRFDPAPRDVLPGRYRGGQPEHARRGHLLGLVCARPEPDLAAATGPARASAHMSADFGTSARARTPAQASVPARAPWWRRSCSGAGSGGGRDRSAVTPRRHGRGLRRGGPGSTGTCWAWASWRCGRRPTAAA